MMKVFSTITSPAFSELVVILAAHVIRFPQDVTFFERLHRMYEVRRFKLVFLLEILGSPQERARWELMEAMESATAKGTFDFLDSPPTIRITRPCCYWRGAIGSPPKRPKRP